jgi:SAM-dependent methyltransferase
VNGALPERRHEFRGQARCRFHGTDIDPEAIAWCRAHLPDLAQWDVNGHAPPLRCESGTFDLIYAVSVFTHLDEARQFTWREELRRVTKPGGLLILTVHGAAYYDKVAMPERGILHKVRKTGMLRPGGLPDCYQTTYHTQRHVESEWARFFTIRGYRERGMNNHQDAVLLSRD